MTDSQQGLIQKKSDLKFYYKMAQEAFQADDVDQALKISKSGLEQAKLQNKGDWINKFDLFNANISQQQSLRPSIKKETLTTVKGISSKLAEKLNKSGISSISELANFSSVQLAKIDGIGLSTAKKIILCAQEHLRTKKLNDFSEKGDSLNESDEVQQVNLKVNPREDISKWFDTKFEKPETERWYPPEEKLPEERISNNGLISAEKDIENGEYQEFSEGDMSIVSNDNEVVNAPEERVVIEKPELNINSSSDNSIEISPELARLSSHNLHERDKTSKEILTLSQVKELTQKLGKELDRSEFVIIKETPKLRKLFIGIDLLAVKLVRVKEFLDLIYIIPIKISSLKGSLIVSSEAIEYPSGKNVYERNFHLDRLPKSYLRALSKATHMISSNIGHGGIFIKYLANYLNIDIRLERTITRKNLFFRSGPLQYKVLIEPVLICQNTVGFTEKIIPFAYQKQSNTHIVELSQFSDLLQYLDHKYFFIETYSVQKNALALKCEASYQFMKDLRNYSAPFMVYGFVVLFVTLLQGYSTLSLLINLGYGIILFYFVIIGFIYLKLYKKKSELKREFSAPYYLKKYNFDETNLILINEELSSKLMEQFVYECIGKDAEFNIVNKIEQDNAESFLLKKLNKKKIEDSHLFESETAPHSNNSNGSKDSKIKHDLIDKYSSFLED